MPHQCLLQPSPSPLPVSDRDAKTVSIASASKGKPPSSVRNKKDKVEQRLKVKSSNKLRQSASAKKHKMRDRTVQLTGTWIQCVDTGCMKWRLLQEVQDPTTLPDRWVCSMNSDVNHNSCDAPEQDWEDDDEDKDFVYTKYTEGSLVWAKMDGYPWWPGMVEVDPDSDMFFESRGPHENTATHYHIVFFGDSVSRYWLAEARIKPFTGGEIPKEIGPFKGKSKDYKKQVSAARTTAMKALQLSVSDRVKIFGFSSRYKGRWAPESDVEDDEDSENLDPSPKPRRKKATPRKHSPDHVGDVGDVTDNAALEIMKPTPDCVLPRSNTDTDSAEDLPKKKPKMVKMATRDQEVPSVTRPAEKTQAKQLEDEDGAKKRQRKSLGATTPDKPAHKKCRAVLFSAPTTHSKPAAKSMPTPAIADGTVSESKPKLAAEFDSDVFTMEMGETQVLEGDKAKGEQGTKAEGGGSSAMGEESAVTAHSSTVDSQKSNSVGSQKSRATGSQKSGVLDSQKSNGIKEQDVGSLPSDKSEFAQSKDNTESSVAQPASSGTLKDEIPHMDSEGDLFSSDDETEMAGDTKQSQSHTGPQQESATGEVSITSHGKQTVAVTDVPSNLHTSNTTRDDTPASGVHTAASPVLGTILFEDSMDDIDLNLEGLSPIAAVGGMDSMFSDSEPFEAEAEGVAGKGGAVFTSTPSQPDQSQSLHLEE